MSRLKRAIEEILSLPFDQEMLIHNSYHVSFLPFHAYQLVNLDFLGLFTDSFIDFFSFRFYLPRTVSIGLDSTEDICAFALV